MRNYVTQTLSLILGLSKIGFPNIYSQVSIGVTSFPIPDAVMIIRSHKNGHLPNGDCPQRDGAISTKVVEINYFLCCVWAGI